MQYLTICPACESKKFSSFIKTKAQMHASKAVFNFDQCTNCKLVFLNPRLDYNELNEYYTDYYLPYRGPEAWGKYKKLVINSQRKLDIRKAKMVNKFHPLSNEKKILDIGCGNPTFLEEIVHSYNCTGSGIDFSDKGWKNDKQRFANLHLKVGEVADINNDERPDVITMWHYLEHDYTPVENLKKLRAIAKKETTLIIEVPNIMSDSRIKYAENWAGWHTPRHSFLFSPDTIETVLNRSGWKVKQMMTYGTLDPYVLYWMSEMEAKGIAWDKNMEDEFYGFVLGMIPFTLKKWQQKYKSLGVLSVIAEPA